MRSAPRPAMRCSAPCWTRAFRSGHGARRRTPTRWPRRTGWRGTPRCSRDGIGGCTTFICSGRSTARPSCCSRRARIPTPARLAIEQLLANEPKERAAAFALAAYPAAVAGHLPIGAEAVNDLGRLAQPMLTVNGEISWQERLSEQGTTHPELANYRDGASASRRRAPRTCPATPLLLPRQQARRRQAARVRAGVPPVRAGVRQREDRMTPADVASPAPEALARRLGRRSLRAHRQQRRPDEPRAERTDLGHGARQRRRGRALSTRAARRARFRAAQPAGIRARAPQGVRFLGRAGGASGAGPAPGAVRLPAESRAEPGASDIAARRATRSIRRSCSASAPRGATTRGARCSGPAPASRVNSSSSTDEGSTHDRQRLSQCLPGVDRREPARHPRRAEGALRGVHRHRADAGRHVRGASAAPGEPRLRPRALPHRSARQGSHLPRVPARAAAAYRALHHADAARTSRGRRGHQRHHPPQPRPRLQRDDEPLLRRRAWRCTAAAPADRR